MFTSIVTFFTGVILGWWACAMLASAKHADECAECEKRNKWEPPIHRK